MVVQTVSRLRFDDSPGHGLGVCQAVCNTHRRCRLVAVLEVAVVLMNVVPCLWAPVVINYVVDGACLWFVSRPVLQAARSLFFEVASSPRENCVTGAPPFGRLDYPAKAAVGDAVAAAPRGP